jgi:hypothetical protein
VTQVPGPDESYGKGWTPVLDTADPLLADDSRRFPAPGDSIEMCSRSVLILQRSF